MPRLEAGLIPVVTDLERGFRELGVRFGLVGALVAEYARMGRTIHKTLLDHQVDTRYQRRTVKVGRNALCPCGSGRKYKVCCGA